MTGEEIRTLTFHVFDTSIPAFSSNPYDTQKGCPWIPEETRNKVAPGHFELNWRVAEHPHSTTHQCIVTLQDRQNQDKPEWVFSVTTLKRDLTKEDFAQMKSEDRSYTRTAISSDDQLYAGVGFEIDRDIYWRCGKYLIYQGAPARWHAKNPTFTSDSQKITYARDSLLGNNFIKAQREALCGKRKNPTPGVTNFPYAEWYTHYFFDEGDPESYGVKRPDDVPLPKSSTKPKTKPTPTSTSSETKEP